MYLLPRLRKINNNTQPDSISSLNVITDNGSLPHSSSSPYVAVVKYNGSWYSQMGDPNYPVDKTGYGDERFALDCSSWDKVFVEAQKEDYGEGELTIQLLRNDKVVAEKFNYKCNRKGSGHL